MVEKPAKHKGCRLQNKTWYAKPRKQKVMGLPKKARLVLRASFFACESGTFLKARCLSRQKKLPLAISIYCFSKMAERPPFRRMKCSTNFWMRHFQVSSSRYAVFECMHWLVKSYQTVEKPIKSTFGHKCLRKNVQGFAGSLGLCKAIKRRSAPEQKGTILLHPGLSIHIIKNV